MNQPNRLPAVPFAPAGQHNLEPGYFPISVPHPTEFPYCVRVFNECALRLHGIGWANVVGAFGVPTRSAFTYALRSP